MLAAAISPVCLRSSTNHSCSLKLPSRAAEIGSIDTTNHGDTKKWLCCIAGLPRCVDVSNSVLNRGMHLREIGTPHAFPRTISAADRGLIGSQADTHQEALQKARDQLPLPS